LAEGNALADRIVATAQLQQAHRSHGFFHQSAGALCRQFQLSKMDARAVVAACPDCARVTPLQDGGANPRGLNPQQLWQTDVTEFAPFGRLRFLHVSVDTCSAVMWATAA
ncbi:POK10 protein, partial [Rynchops niger]|nr:POK10 protein [Rynchops niger]